MSFGEDREPWFIYGQPVPKEIIFDKRGDLRLVVNGSWSFVVCSRALARASTVFDRMLHGGFAESKPSEGDWVANLPEESLHGLCILLEIIHGNVHTLSREIGEHLESEKQAAYLLCEVAITADKYELVHIFKPWVGPWLGYCRAQGSYLHEGECNTRWLGELIWCAWVFGDEEMLLRGLDGVLLSMHMRTVQPDGEVDDTDVQSKKPGAHGSPRIEDDDDMRGYELTIKNINGWTMPLYSPEGLGNEILNLIGLGM